MKITNIAAYKFIELNELAALRLVLKELCITQGIKGTILLSAEGINLSLAGTKDTLQIIKDWLAADGRFADLYYKESYSNEQPFNRMLVKIKKEIISMGVPTICPQYEPAPRISPQELCAWLDAGKEITLLDTRNEYEVRLGTFQNALTLPLEHFRLFPQIAKVLDPALKDKPMVTFCTGGIRCEKAAPLLQSYGFREVYQLEGGILEYFKTCGGKHYEGECFVYDRRVALNAALAETDTTQCYACLKPVSIEEQQLPSYVPTISCPACIHLRI